ncbi:KR domain-containing protein [Dactylosporangium sp. NPDC000555]|uniref:type I polyketide synthase n=1 Tax=Dactylosporangium sp. NPDC000555 TaxID=3154260 RepID=UPI003325CBD1
MLALDERPAPGRRQAPAGLVSTVELLRALDSAGVTAPLWCVTSGAVAVGGEPLARPGQAPVWGLGQVALLEQEPRWGGLVDLPGEPGADAVRGLAAVLAGGHDEDQVALRPGGGHMRRLLRVDPPAGPAQRDRSPAGGAALITGGLGELTAQLARWLAGRGATHIMVTDVDGADTTTVRALRAELAGLGAELTVTDRGPGDCEPPAGLALSTVVHRAGQEEAGSALTALTDAELDDAMHAAVSAVESLDRLPAAEDASLMLLTPLSGVWGAVRRGASTAACAAVQALAHRRRDRGAHALVVALGGQDSRPSAIDRPLTPATVTALLERLLDQDEPSGVIADLDVDRIVASAPAPRVLGLMRELPEVTRALRAASAEEGTEPAAALTGRLLPLDPPARRKVLLDLVTGHAAAVLGHSDRRTVRPDQAFSDGGFDSMLAVQFRNQLRTATGVRLATTVVFDYPTPNAVVDVLYDELCSEAAESGQVLGELARLETALADLSPDTPVGKEIADRLNTLVRRWAPSAAPAVDADRIGAATADELFEILDSDYGVV